MCIHHVRRKVMTQKTVFVRNWSRFFIIFFNPYTVNWENTVSF